MLYWDARRQQDAQLDWRRGEWPGFAFSRKQEHCDVCCVVFDESPLKEDAMNFGSLCGTLAAGTLALSGLTGCTHDRVANGALIGAGAGAVVAGVAGGSVVAGAAIGAAGGAIVGAITRHNDGYCYRRDSNGNDYRVDCR